MWKAEFTDGSILVEKQSDLSYDEFCAQMALGIIPPFDSTKDRSFGDVLKRLTELKSLALITSHGDEYVVNFQDGVFTITREGISTYMYGLDPKTYQKVDNIRPIYFVRERADFTLGISREQQVVPITEFYALGLQALLFGKNVQRYLKIFPDRTFEMCEE